MPVYFAYHPEIGIQAQITAPTTRKARTTYMDYLTRRELVPWRGRQDLKKSVMIDRIEAGQVPVDVELRYQYGQPTPEVGEDQTSDLSDPVDVEDEYMPRGLPKQEPRSNGLARSIVPGKQSKAAQSLVPKPPKQSGVGQSRLSRSMIPKAPARSPGRRL